MTIRSAEFLDSARALGFRFWAGVPCSYLRPFINHIVDAEGLTYVSSANEGDAVAVASGAVLGGRKAVVLMQNSGLGNAVSPLSSLNWVFRIPVLVIVTLRGDPDIPDEPQHELMGRVTPRILETLEIPWQWFPQDPVDLPGALEAAEDHMNTTGRPYALIMRKGTVRDECLQAPPIPAAVSRGPIPDHPDMMGKRPTRREVLQHVVAGTGLNDSVVIGSTGYNAHELYAIDDRPNHLYMVGSMGCASSLGLGLSMVRPELKTVVLDGDGAALMRMGNLATIGAYGGPGLLHLLLDNHQHESTGGQATVSRGVRFAAVAGACGYRTARNCAGSDDLDRFLATAEGPAFLHIDTSPGTPGDLPRPTLSPAAIKSRLMQHLGAVSPWAGIGA